MQSNSLPLAADAGVKCFGGDMIETNYGAVFEESNLVDYIKKSGRNYIIQGQTACSMHDHPKPNSLDYWLRQFGKNPNTKQADNDLMTALVATGLFRESKHLICPDSGNPCKGLVIVE
jgi:hypothetical protein